MESYDFLVIGAGMAGISAGYELAPLGRTIVLEREAWPAYHTTGRSAAHFTETYGNATIRRLVRAGRAFLESPPQGFAETPLLIPRSLFLIAPPGREGALEQALTDARRLTPAVRSLSVDEAIARVPILRRERLAAAMHEPDSRDMDVHALHQGFLRGMKARGGELACNAEVRGITRSQGTWTVETSSGVFRAAVLINAAGAWADIVAEMAGAAPLGLVPKRRTVLIIDPPSELDISSWPLVVDVDETLYFKPDAGRLLVSPADATPSPPCDAQPEEIDIATGAARLEEMTTLTVTHIANKWAGLRTFAQDGSPVMGMDERVDGFFWLAGQGGYGIKTSPALARCTAALLEGKDLPADILALGLTQEDLSPRRLRPAAT